MKELRKHTGERKPNFLDRCRRIRSIEHFEYDLLVEYEFGGITFMAGWVDCSGDDRTDRWLVWPVNPDDLQQYIDKKIDYLGLIQASLQGTYFLVDCMPHGDLATYKIPYHEIPQDYIPEVFAYYGEVTDPPVQYAKPSLARYIAWHEKRSSLHPSTYLKKIKTATQWLLDLAALYKRRNDAQTTDLYAKLGGMVEWLVQEQLLDNATMVFADAVMCDRDVPLAWRNTDPRLAFKHGGSIIIVRRNPENGKATIMGEGDTYSESWRISTTFNDHEWIDADENWDDTWYWTEDPFDLVVGR